MRQVDLIQGDVILHRDMVYMVLERDTNPRALEPRERIRYLNLRTGEASTWRVAHSNPVKGEVIRGRETVWEGEAREVG